MSTFLNLIAKDSPLESPFAPRAKCDWIGDIWSTLTGAWGDVTGVNQNNATQLEIARQNMLQQESTNTKNFYLQQVANNENKRQFNEQIKYNWDMFNATNAYNDPKKQVERLIKAGINPATGLGQSTPASSLSAPSPAPQKAAQMVAPQLNYNPLPNDATGLFDIAAQGINAFNASRLASAEVKNKEALTGSTEIDNLFKSKSFDSRIKELESIAQGEGWRADMAKTELAYMQAVNGVRISLMFQDQRMQEQQFKLTEKTMFEKDLNNQLMQVQLAYAPKLNEAELNKYYTTINQLRAQIGLINANAMLTNEERLHEIEKRTGTIIDNGMKGLDYEIKDKTKQTIIDAEKERLYSLGIENEFKSAKNRYGEARVRLLGTDKIEVQDSPLDRNWKRFKHMYKKGVEQGIKKTRH